MIDMISGGRLVPGFIRGAGSEQIFNQCQSMEEGDPQKRRRGRRCKRAGFVYSSEAPRICDPGIASGERHATVRATRSSSFLKPVVWLLIVRRAVAARPITIVSVRIALVLRLLSVRTPTRNPPAVVAVRIALLLVMRTLVWHPSAIIAVLIANPMIPTEVIMSDEYERWRSG
jgi:hypothetical protein